MSDTNSPVELVIDDFEDGDLSEYDRTNYGTDIRTDLTYDGTYALELPARRGSTADAQCVSVSGGIQYPSRGDSFGGYLFQPDEVNQFRYVFAAQSAKKDPDGYNVAISGSRDFLIEVDRRGTELDRTSLSDVDHTNKWLELVIDWDYEAGTDTTTITATLNDKGPDGTENNGQLVQIQGSESPSTYASGGLAFNADARGSAMAFDNAMLFDSRRSTTVSTSVTALHYINGGNENFTQGGHPLDSSQMQLFRRDESPVSVFLRFGGYETELEVPVEPVIDNWQKGDMVEELPEELEGPEGALKPERGKNEDEFGPRVEFNKYRFMNQIQVSFESLSRVIGGPIIDPDSIEITFNENATVDDEKVEFDGESESYTVLVDPDEEDVDDSDDAEINNLLGHGWFEDFDDLRERGTRKPRYYSYEIVQVDGMEALRVATISGAYAGFSHRIADLGKDAPSFFGTIWDWDGIGGELAERAWLWMPEEVHDVADALAVVPNIYSFLEVFVLADGRRFTRVWDASPFPGVTLYVDGTRRWVRPVDYEPRERRNSQMETFFNDAVAELAPYHATSLRNYLNTFTARKETPRKTLGLHADGTPIEDTDEFLPYGFLDPREVRVPPNG